MREAFSQHFAADQDRREKLWGNCLFVFDTNVLTGIYRRSEEAREAQYKLMVELGDRLWVPHRVIYEYLDNRAKIVHDQAQLYASSIGELQNMLASFENSTRHPFLSAAAYEFRLVSEKVLVELGESREFHDSRITDDDVKLKLAEIFDGKVGAPFSEERIAEIVKDGEARYAQNIPPGFEDRGKHKGSTITEEITKRYGDLIIWYQVIEKAKAEQRPVILVTGDQKPDWWAEQSGKKLGPHPSLIKEFSTLSGQDFYLYTYHGFLDFANKYLDQKTSESVIEEVRESALLDAEALDDSAYESSEEMSSTSFLSVGEDGRERFYNKDFSLFANEELRALVLEETRLSQEIHDVERRRAGRKKLLAVAASDSSRVSDGAKKRLEKDLILLTTNLKMLQRQLSIVRHKLNVFGFQQDLEV